METVDIKTPSAQYTAYVGEGMLQKAGELAGPAEGNRAAVITDENAGPLYAPILCASLEASGYAAEVLTLPSGEKTKSLSSLSEVYSFLARCRLTRKDTVFALGGGVIGDLAGFAAATFLRGVPYVQCPTTLLSMVDSSVGGKTGIDLPEGKNLAGAFYHPKAVVADTAALSSLPPRQIACGMAEIIKHACILDAELFENLRLPHDRLVARNMELKRGVVQADEFESGLREILNFGHTLGHAAEALGSYERYTHGEAVAIGMVLAVKIGIRLGITPADILPALERTLQSHALPIHCDFSPEELMRFAASDKKKKGGTITMIFLPRIGAWLRRAVSTDELVRLLGEIL